MFGLDVEKLLVIAVVALVVIGPRDLPDTLRRAGRTVANLRRMLAQYRAQFDEMIKDTEFEEARKELQAVRAGLQDTATSLLRAGPSVTDPAPTPAAGRPAEPLPATDIATPPSAKGG